MEKKDLFGYPYAQLEAEMLSRGESKYRARQLYGWIYEKGVYDFEKMTDISKAVSRLDSSDRSFPSM
jgi:23S rRNA (adenine2503-C2)-methyltransferase